MNPCGVDASITTLVDMMVSPGYPPVVVAGIGTEVSAGIRVGNELSVGEEFKIDILRDQCRQDSTILEELVRAFIIGIPRTSNELTG